MNQSNVKALRPADEPCTIAAIGMSVVANFGRDRQATLQTHVAQDQTEAEIDSQVDRLFRVIDRQKARYEIIDLEDELVKHAQTLALFREDHDRLEAEHQHKVAGLKIQIEEIDATAARARETGYQEHVTSGRQTEYQPKGATKAAIERAAQAAKAVQGEIDKLEAERTVALANLGTSAARYEEQIVKLKDDIVKRHAIIGT